MVKQSIELLQRKMQEKIAELQAGQYTFKKGIELDAELNAIQRELNILIETKEHFDPSLKKIIDDIESNRVTVPNWFLNNVDWVQRAQITPDDFMLAYNDLIRQGLVTSPAPEPIPEAKQTWWVTQPSGIIRQLTVTQEFVNTMTVQGWIFSKQKPPEPEPEPILEPIPEVITEPIPEVITEVIPTIDDSINTNMVTQQLINFNIINGRAVGSIKFVATENFNPYYYNKEIINLVQFKTPNGVTLLVKENRLRFTETERDEIINYDEDMKGNTRATVESFVWEWIDKPAGAFSSKYTIDISEKEPPKPMTPGFMGAGVAGAIAGLILIGFIADHKRGK